METWKIMALALALATPALAEEYDAPTAFNGKVDSAIQETLSLACTPYKGDKVYIDITFGGPNNESIDKLVVNHVLPDGRSYNRAKQYTSQTELDAINEKHLYQWAGNTPKGDRMIAALSTSVQLQMATANSCGLIRKRSCA